MHFYTWKKEKIYIYIQKNGCYQLDQCSLAFFFFFFFWFSALVTFKFFMEIIYASSYQILQIQYKDMKLGGPSHIFFCVCVNYYDLRLYILLKLAKSCKETWLSFVSALPFGTILNIFQEIWKREEKKIPEISSLILLKSLMKFIYKKHVGTLEVWKCLT